MASIVQGERKQNGTKSVIMACTDASATGTGEPRKSESIRKTRQPKAYTRIARVATERSIAECVQKCQKSAPKASERSTSTTKTTHPSPSIRTVYSEQ